MDLRRKEGGEKLRKDNRDQVLVMRMTKEEKEKLRMACDEDGKSISDFVRKGINMNINLVNARKNNSFK